MPSGSFASHFLTAINTSLNLFWLARERGRKTKTIKLIADGIGSTWVQLERVNPSPSPTHLTRESEWAKMEVVLKVATWCSRETESIQGKFDEREFTPTIV
ncbi:hypothetical protein H5410_046759 [Solanum commersonii]|uniref:Uncharacterized protein n=1 Tax=Solanum commersonii TaxID=4109 RepID=A0A9J5XF68_SOLCO|nr:hypothetical protein H5410_046759 [Solanum commersonii]